jgi:lysophospholipase L1-like esterase
LGGLKVNKKIIMIVSLVLNLCFIAVFGYMIYKRGGLGYIYDRVTSISNQEVVMSFYHGQRKSLFDSNDIVKDAIVFAGDSITDNNEWHETFKGPIYNRAIGGDTTAGILDILDEIIKYHPAKLFLMAGINDLNQKYEKEEVVENYKQILERTKNESPETEIYIHSILPVNLELAQPKVIGNEEFELADIEWINGELKKLQNEYNFTFLDLHPMFADKNNQLKKEYTNDGVHLTGKAYKLWEEFIRKYVEK